MRVVLVEPGPVRTTRFGATYVANLRPVSRTYETFRRESAEYSEAIYTGSRRTLAGSFAIQPDDVARRVAKVVAKGVRGARSRARSPVGQSPPTRRAIKERPRMAYLPFGSGPVTARERGTAAPRPSRRTAPAESAACPTDLEAPPSPVGERRASVVCRAGGTAGKNTVNAVRGGRVGGCAQGDDHGRGRTLPPRSDSGSGIGVPGRVRYRRLP
ncbi:hypothetical protein [Streptomyces malaysiensis]|uniref:hypothetical protein n=1 Tax=Streptomyces malaysiensis TaxID=92644 RepID=UPI0036B0B3CE